MRHTQWGYPDDSSYQPLLIAIVGYVLAAPNESRRDQVPHGICDASNFNADQRPYVLAITGREQRGHVGTLTVRSSAEARPSLEGEETRSGQRRALW